MALASKPYTAATKESAGEVPPQSLGIAESLDACCKGRCPQNAPSDSGKRVSWFEYSVDEEERTCIDSHSSISNSRDPGRPTPSSSMPFKSRCPAIRPVLLEQDTDAEVPSMGVAEAVSEYAAEAAEEKIDSTKVRSEDAVVVGRRSQNSLSSKGSSSASDPAARHHAVSSAAPRHARRPSQRSTGSSSITAMMRRLLGEYWYESDTAHVLRKTLSSRAWDCFTLLAVFCALFLADIYVLAQVPESTSLDILLVVVFAIFFLELLARVLVVESYPNSFFFWMDIIGTISLLFDISLFFGEDATEIERYDRSSLEDTAVLTRASRAAKQAARTGRMSRALKLLRFLPISKTSGTDDGKAGSKSISLKLTSMLATRVAFLVLMVVIFMPSLNIISYPEVEQSMSTWALLLSTDVNNYYAAVGAEHRQPIITRLNSEMSRMVTFYSGIETYGPFAVCFRVGNSTTFVCEPGSLPGTVFQPSFHEPRRQSSAFQVTEGDVRIKLNFATVQQYESLTSILLMLCVLALMWVTCLIISSSVGVVVQRTLERVFSVARQHCAEIVSVSKQLHETQIQQDNLLEADDFLDDDHATDVALLEKVLERIAGVCANLVPAELKPYSAEEDELNNMFMSFAGESIAMSSQLTHMSSQSSGDWEVARQTTGDSTLPQSLRASLDSIDFNVFEVNDLEKQRALAAYALFNCEPCSRWTRRNLRREQVDSFLAIVQNNYKPNPFHNFLHAVDVACEVRLVLQTIGAGTFLSEVTCFWLLIAAIGHDIGHPGVNGPFLVETADKLALLYNDRSVLENLHCTLLFQVLREKSANVFEVFDKQTYKEARKGVVDAILHTDMTKHNECVKDLTIFYSMNQEMLSDGGMAVALADSAQGSQLITNALLHTADVSNPMKPWQLCELLADLCLEEFFLQGDQEKVLGIPVQMLNDREKVNRPTSQVGFIEFVIAPLAVQMVSLFPKLSHLTENIGFNIMKWAQIWKESCHPSDAEWLKLEDRVVKVVDRCNALLKDAF